MIRAALLSLLISQAHAGEVVMHLNTRHDPECSSDGSRLNDWNPGFGYIADSGLMAGAYLNSYRRPSAYAHAGPAWASWSNPILASRCPHSRRRHPTPLRSNTDRSPALDHAHGSFAGG